MSDEPEEQNQPDEYDPDDYHSDHDDDVLCKVDWIATGMLFFRVRPLDGEKEFEHCPEVSAAFVMQVSAIDISGFELDVIWLEYFEKVYD